MSTDEQYNTDEVWEKPENPFMEVHKNLIVNYLTILSKENSNWKIEESEKFTNIFYMLEEMKELLCDPDTNPWTPSMILLVPKNWREILSNRFLIKKIKALINSNKEKRKKFFTKGGNIDK